MPPYWVLEEYEAHNLSISSNYDEQIITPTAAAEGAKNLVAINNTTQEAGKNVSSSQKKQKKRKNLLFDCKDTIHIVPNRDEMSSYECKKRWYSITELSRIRSWNHLTVRLMLFYGKIDEDRHCIRGLEHHFDVHDDKRINLMRDKIRTNSIYAVLTEQSQQRRRASISCSSSSTVWDHEQIAKAYGAYTRSCTDEAYGRGLRDRRYVIKSFLLSSLSSGTNVSSLQHHSSSSSSEEHHNSKTRTSSSAAVQPQHQQRQGSFNEDDLHYLQNMMNDVGYLSSYQQNNLTVQQQEQALSNNNENDITTTSSCDEFQYLKDLMDDAGIVPSLQYEKDKNNETHRMMVEEDREVCNNSADVKDTIHHQKKGDDDDHHHCTNTSDSTTSTRGRRSKFSKLRKRIGGRFSRRSTM